MESLTHSNGHNARVMNTNDRGHIILETQSHSPVNLSQQN